MPTQKQKAERFRSLHQQDRGFLMPNAWDAGSAIILAGEGFPAIGTTSAGIAFSLGKSDFTVADKGLAVSRDEMLDRARLIVEAVPMPVNGDLEHGYGGSPQDVASTVLKAIEIGLAGGNIEDHDPRGRDGGLYDDRQACERIQAARAAIDAGSHVFLLNAKIDLLQLRPDAGMAACIQRANLLLEAGADCAYPLGANDLDTVKLFVREIAGPVNIVIGWADRGLTVNALLDAGVTRVSVGGSIARSALGFVRASARELAGRGTTDYTGSQMPHTELNALFARARSDSEG